MSVIQFPTPANSNGRPADAPADAEAFVAVQNLGLIECLRGLLAEAESGDLQSLAFAGVRPGNDVVTGWDCAPGQYVALCGSTLMLGHELATGEGDDG